MSTEPYGTTPLPAKGVSLRYDPGDDIWEIAQQPKSQQIAAYEGLFQADSIHGATVLDVNQHFVIYAVKKGLIRILHRHSTLRTLFRGHEGQVVSDIRVFLDGDVIGSVGTSSTTTDPTKSTVIIWRVFERTPEIMSEILLEITTDAYQISRLIWHPFNPNQFWIIHHTTTQTSSNSEGENNSKIASLVDTTRISTLPHETEQHAVCMFHMPHIIMDGVVELSPPSTSGLTDLDWSEKDVRHVMTVHTKGEIRLWDLRKVEPSSSSSNSSTMLPACLVRIQEEDQPLSRCKFLPHECPRDHAAPTQPYYTNCFLTAAHNNSVITLWSPFGPDSTPTKLQVFGLESPSTSYLLDICYAPSPPDGPPPSLFCLQADQTDGKLLTWHLQSEWQDNNTVTLVGCNYVVPFVTSYPMYSWSTQVAPAADISEDELEGGSLVFDMKLFSYQSSVVQCLILTSFMCLPPASQFQETSTYGVTVEPLPQAQQLQLLETVSNPALSEDFEGEEYDVGDDDDEQEEDYSEPPAASALPVPEGLDSPAAVSTPGGDFGGGAFANWLGALAVSNNSNTTTTIPPPPVVAPLPPVVPAPVATTTMLTPADLFPNHPSIQQPNDAPSDGLPTSLPRSPPEGQAQKQPNQTGNNNNNKKGKFNKKGNKSRSRSPTNQKQNGGKGQQQTPPQQQQILAPGQDVTILQRKSDAPLGPPPGMAPSTAAVPASTTTTTGGVDLSAQFEQQQAAIASEIQKAVQAEMQQTVIPLMDQKVRACVDQSILPVLASMNSIGKDGVQVDHDKLVDAITAKVEAPLRAAFAENMKTVLIPAFQAVSTQMFSQIAVSLDNGMAAQAAGGASNGKIEEMSNQLTTMTALVKQLASEVENLRSVVSEQQQQQQQGGRDRTESIASSTGANAAAEKAALEQEVMQFLSVRQYEAAFTKALSASTVEMALFVCSHADLADVLGGSVPSLSQPILLCLMHQLGTSVVTSVNDENNLSTELAWLQEVSLSINPMDESMKRHLPSVLQQLVTGINDKMARNEQPTMRRPLQRLLQVLRGVQVQ
eukprot:Sro634_g178970.2  (1050) ;mRNA; r:16882-20183